MVYKITLLGDGNVGKSTYKEFLKDKNNFNFLEHRNHIPTNYEHSLDSNLDMVKIYDSEFEILDCPGQEPCFRDTEKLSYSSDAIIIMYDKSILDTKKNVLDKWLPIVDDINKNRIHKIPVAIIGNKSDTGGKHTLRYSNVKASNCKNLSLFTMSLKHETCCQYEKDIYSKWKNIYNFSTSNKKILKDELFLPILYLEENIYRG